MEPWLGRYRFATSEGEVWESREAYAAVFCDSAEAFESLLKSHLSPLGVQVLWIEDIQTLACWQDQDGQDKRATVLAASVSSLNRVALLSADGTPVSSAYLTITEHDFGIQPGQSSTPTWEQDWIGPELKSLIFGPVGKTPTPRTYFIVDATSRKEVVGTFDLEADSHDVPLQCLFKGNAVEELKEAAPYLIDMTLPEGAWDDSVLVPRFHKDFFRKHWGQNTGIFIRTHAPFPEVLAHFRRFPRIQVEADRRWVYFRFWDPRIAPTYFDSIRSTPEKAAQWFDMRGEHRIEQIIGDQADSGRAWSITPDWQVLTGFASKGQPMLSEDEIKGFQKYISHMRDNEIASHIAREATREQKITPNMRELVFISRSTYASMGFKSIGDIKNLALADFVFGVHFHNTILLKTLSIPTDDGSTASVYYSIMEGRVKALNFAKPCQSIFERNLSDTLDLERCASIISEISDASSLHNNYIRSLASAQNFPAAPSIQQRLFQIAQVYLGEAFHVDPRYRWLESKILSEKTDEGTSLNLLTCICDRIATTNFVEGKGVFL